MRTLKWEGGGSAAELEKNGQAFVICGGGGGPPRRQEEERKVERVIRT